MACWQVPSGQNGVPRFSYDAILTWSSSPTTGRLAVRLDSRRSGLRALFVGGRPAMPSRRGRFKARHRSWWRMVCRRERWIAHASSTWPVSRVCCLTKRPGCASGPKTRLRIAWHQRVAGSEENFGQRASCFSPGWRLVKSWISWKNHGQGAPHGCNCEDRPALAPQRRSVCSRVRHVCGASCRSIRRSSHASTGSSVAQR